ncbi:hypothetical protein DL766_001590 [Monosporascus sp. MC13-8B]|uniref:DEUBAD domain-containing protein n=1 Tax=Monosporascus cannonballus TaxID=155416 RepID=A0ABY0HIW5_9PEZI|nr:hypothetical protein DL763_006591 [Monosporascus cannonballus]RYO94476.1 hypothetical protein DL762_000572 [Monosporascus cannonballus]RYP37280.1 hypothetical protein DL766_001590 [Monosporascus sp. MC13-8B]
MGSRKKQSDAGTLQPIRRSTRARKPTRGAAHDDSDDPLSREYPAHDKKVSADEAADPPVRDKVLVQRPAETIEASATDPFSFPESDDKADEEAVAEPTLKRPAGHDDMDAEDKIVAYPGSPRAAIKTPIKSQAYVAGTADRDEDELTSEQPAIKTIKLSNSARKNRSKYAKPEEMLTNPKSPLASTRLRDLLCNPKAWDLLDPEEKKQVLAKFPDQQEILDAGTEKARPDVASLRNNNNFRHDAARYQDNLRKGKHDPEWIRQAQAAHSKREMGGYDEYLATRFEEEWGMKMPGVKVGSEEAEVSTSAEQSISDEADKTAGDNQPTVESPGEAAGDDHIMAEASGEAADNDQRVADQTVTTAATQQEVAEREAGALANDQAMAKKATGTEDSGKMAVEHEEGAAASAQAVAGPTPEAAGSDQAMGGRNRSCSYQSAMTEETTGASGKDRVMEDIQGTASTAADVEGA